MIERAAHANWNDDTRIHVHPLHQMELRANAVILPALRASLLANAAVAAAVGVALLQVADAATVMLIGVEKRKAFNLNLFEDQDVWGVK